MANEKPTGAPAGVTFDPRDDSDNLPEAEATNGPNAAGAPQTSGIPAGVTFDSSPARPLAAPQGVPPGVTFDSSPAHPLAPPSEKPTFTSRNLEGFGLPKNKEEYRAAAADAASKKSLAIHALDPTGGAAVDAATGLWGYAKRVAGNVYNDAHEAVEAGENIGKGGPVGANVGKAAFAAAHTLVSSVPFIGESAENATTDTVNKNWGALAGDVTSIIGQTLVPEYIHEYIQAHPSAAKVRLNKLNGAMVEHNAADTIHKIVTDGHQVAMNQVTEAQHRAELASQNETAGQGTREQTVAAQTNLTEATANLQRTGESVRDAAENKAKAAAKVEMAQRDLDNAAKEKAKPKRKIGTAEDIKKSKEDLEQAIPSGPGKSAVSSEDREKVRPLLENSHATGNPVDSPQAVHDSMQSHQDRMEAELAPWLEKYKDEHPSLGTNDDGTPASIKQRMVEALADDEKVRPGFTEKALAVLENYENTTDPTISEAERIRKALNDDNRGLLQKDRMDVATARATNPEFAGRYELARIIREGTYGLLENKGVANAAQLRNLEASAIRVKNAAGRMINKPDTTMRGSNEVGSVRKGLAWAAKKAGIGAGAAAGVATGIPGAPEAGAMAMGAVGDAAAGKLAPGELTRSQQIKRSLDVNHTSGEVPHLETTGNQPSNPPAFELPPDVSEPPEPVHPNDMTELHASIAAYSGELPTPGSYAKQEAKFLSDYAIKRKYGLLKLPEYASDVKLHERIGEAEIENAQTSRKAAKEKIEEEQKATEQSNTDRDQKKQDIMSNEAVAHGLFADATEPAMEIGGVSGHTSEQIHGHEAGGHVMANVAEGLEPFQFLSEHHEDARNAKGGPAAAAIQTDVSGAKPGSEGIDQRVVGILGGPAFDEVHHNMPWKQNSGARGDVARARQILREEGGYTPDEVNKVFNELYERAKEHVSNPDALAVVRANLGLREEGLDKEYHMSPTRMKEYAKKLKGAYNANTPTTAGVLSGGPDGGLLEGESDNAGAEGKEQNGRVEKAPAEEARKADESAKPAAGKGTEISEVKKTPSVPPERSTGNAGDDEAIKKGGGVPGGRMTMDAENHVRMFHDPESGTTLGFSPKETVTPEATAEKLRASRAQYAAADKPKTEQSNINHDEVLDNIKRAYGVHDDPKMERNAGFITSDGRHIDLPSNHQDAIEEHGGAPANGEKDNRRDFINDTGTVRVHKTQERGGKVLAFSVPEGGVSAAQADAMQRSFGANGDRNGLLRMERADISPETRNTLSTEKEFPSASDVKPMLQKIQALEQSNVDKTDQVAAHEANGGSTFTPEGENLAGKDLYSVGAHPDRTLSVDKLTPEVLAKFKADNADLLSQGDRAVGTWKDPDTGKSVLDITKLHTDRDAAVAAGQDANQKAIYHLGSGETIPTGGTGEGTGGEDFNFGKNAEGTEDQQKGIISTAVPTGTKAIADPHTENVHIGMHSVTPEAAVKIANKIREMPGMRIPDGLKDPQKVISKYIDQFKNNLKDLYNQVPKETRDATAKWYESANKIGDRIASKYGKSTKQGAGVLAAMSPQKDWNMNVGLAERTTDIYHQHADDSLAPEAHKKAGEIGLGGMADAIGDKTLNQLTEPLEKAAFIRIWDETHNDRSFKYVDPGTGDYTHTMTNNDGSNSKIAWGALNEIAKAVNILDDGSRENISRNLGGSHKVRNFYNNIVDPNNPGGHVTIDTHAVAAGHQRPLSGKDPEVLDNFGRLSVAATGLKGTYAVHAEAYRQAAAELGIQPRQLQSITWEQVRKNFPAELKSSPAHRTAIDDIWGKYKDGKITQSQAQQQVSAYAKTAREQIAENAEKPATLKPDNTQKSGVANLGDMPVLKSKYLNLHGAK